MTLRKVNKAVKRLVHLPLSGSLFRYMGNKAHHFVLKAKGDLAVAYPSTVMLELTNHCNLHCTTCPREYDFGKSMDKGNMPLERAKAIVDELWPYLDSIGLTGMGETLMYKDLPSIVDYIRSKSKGIIITLSTNAVLPNFIDKVSPLIGKVDTIQISTDGLDDVYEAIRIGSSFDTLKGNIKALSALCYKTRTTLMLNMVVTAENYHQMADMVYFSSEVGVRYLNFTPINLSAVTGLGNEYYDLFASSSFKEQLHRLSETSVKEGAVEVTGWDYSQKGSFKNCPFPWSHFYITWDGYVPPCCSKPFPKLLNFGNVFGKGVMPVLNSPSYCSFRSDWRNDKTPSFCSKCHFISLNS